MGGRFEGVLKGHAVIVQYRIIVACLVCAGAMYAKLSDDLTVGLFNRVASLWFVSMVIIFMSGNNALSIAYSQKPLLRCSRPGL